MNPVAILTPAGHGHAHVQSEKPDQPEELTARGFQSWIAEDGAHDPAAGPRLPHAPARIARKTTEPEDMTALPLVQPHPLLTSRPAPNLTAGDAPPIATEPGAAALAPPTADLSQPALPDRGPLTLPADAAQHSVPDTDGPEPPAGPIPPVSASATNPELPALPQPDLVADSPAPTAEPLDFLPLSAKSSPPDEGPGDEDAEAPDPGADTPPKTSLRSEISQTAAILIWKSAPAWQDQSALAAPSAAQLPVAQPEDQDQQDSAAAALFADPDQPLPSNPAPTALAPTAATPAPSAPAPAAQPAPGATSPLPQSLPDLRHLARAIQHDAHRHTSSSSPVRSELILEPAELGRVQFSLTGSGHHLAITISADNPGTLALLQQGVGDLRAELAREGIDTASLSFVGSQADPQANAGGQGRFALPRAEEAGDDLPPPPDLRPSGRIQQGLGGAELNIRI